MFLKKGVVGHRTHPFRCQRHTPNRTGPTSVPYPPPSQPRDGLNG